MEPRADDQPRQPPASLAGLIERGVVLPASRRLSEVLGAHPPLKLDDPRAATRALAEQRGERA